MKTPFTVPQIVFKAYDRHLTEDQLISQYKGRIVRPEDQEWDKDLQATLAQLCLDLVIRDYEFFVRLTDETNEAAKLRHTQNHDKWEKDVENYHLRRRSYERKVFQAEIWSQKHSDDFDNDDDDDDQPGKPGKTLVTPVNVPSNFPLLETLKPVLDRLSDQDRVEVIESLNVKEIPLKVAIQTIPDAFYWQRATNDKWPDADKGSHGGNRHDWRQTYTEKFSRELLDSFHPFEQQLPPLLEQIELIAPFVRQLTLINLIPNCFGVESRPRIFKPFIEDEGLTGEDEGFPFATELKRAAADLKKSQDDEEFEYTDETKIIRDNSHLDLSLVLPQLKFLRKLCLIYEMQEMGMDWEARFCDFTDKDVENLAKGLTLAPTIEHFELNRSRMTSEQCKILVRDGLMKMPHLQILNISYNNIRNAGAKAIARLLIEQRPNHTLHTLSMARNKIKNKGASAIAYALTLNSHLSFLDLRLNLIGDDGCQDFGHALVKNRSLISLNLAANRITDEGCYVISKMLHHNNTLKQLDLSSNDLGQKGGEYLTQAARKNKIILKLDVRLGAIGLDFEYDIETHLRRHRARLPYSLLDKNDVDPPNVESQVDLFDGSEGEEQITDEEEEELTTSVIMPVEKMNDSDSDHDTTNISKSPKHTNQIKLFV